MITVDYAMPPAIVRFDNKTRLMQPQGEEGKQLQEVLDAVQKLLDESLQWRLTGQSGKPTDVYEIETTDDSFDVSQLKLMPPKRTYTVQAQFYYAGRGEPLPYDFSGMFDDEEETDN